jgi:hypothetical protein
MNVNDLVRELDGMEYGTRINKEILDNAKQNGLVIVYGASDDIMVFDGAIYDSVSVFEGGYAYLSESPKINGLLQNKCDNPDCPYYMEKLRNVVYIEAIWNDNGSPCWYYKTKIPHETFNVYENDSLYCQGIVFDLNNC